MTDQTFDNEPAETLGDRLRTRDEQTESTESHDHDVSRFEGEGGAAAPETPVTPATETVQS